MTSTAMASMTLRLHWTAETAAATMVHASVAAPSVAVSTMLLWQLACWAAAMTSAALPLRVAGGGARAGGEAAAGAGAGALSREVPSREVAGPSSLKAASALHMSWHSRALQREYFRQPYAGNDVVCCLSIHAWLSTQQDFGSGASSCTAPSKVRSLNRVHASCLL